MISTNVALMSVTAEVLVLHEVNAHDCCEGRLAKGWQRLLQNFFLIRDPSGVVVNSVEGQTVILQTLL